MASLKDYVASLAWWRDTSAEKQEHGGVDEISREATQDASQDEMPVTEYQLHYPRDEKALMELLEKSHLDVNAIDPNLGHAPIHSMVTAERPDKLECLLSLLIHGDVDLDLSRTADGKTALHLAAEACDAYCVRALIAFGASLNPLDNTQCTPLDLADASARKAYVKHHFHEDPTSSWMVVSVEDSSSQSRSDSAQPCSMSQQVAPGTDQYDSLESQSETVHLLRTLGGITGSLTHKITSPRLVSAEIGQVHETSPASNIEGTSTDSRYRNQHQSDHFQVEQTTSAATVLPPSQQQACNLREGDLARPQAMELYKDLEEQLNCRMRDMASLTSLDETYAMGLQRKELERFKKTGSRVLCLDGGGIKGLVEIEVLMQIEERTGKKIVELFDWIIGTSTGAIIALALVYAKKSLTDLRRLYFKLKEQVFASPRFGISYNTGALEELLMEALGTHLKMKDVHYPNVVITAVNKASTPLQLHYFSNCFHNKYSDELIWKVARYTSAAPMFFSECDNYVDGGILANNPCLYALTEIQNFHLRKQQRLPISLVVSIGTGVYPKEVLGNIDPHEYLLGRRGFHVLQSLKSLGNLLQLFSNALVESEIVAEMCAGHCAEQGIPYFRFSPQLEDMIAAGEVDNKKLLRMLISSKLQTMREINDLPELL